MNRKLVHATDNLLFENAWMMTLVIVRVRNLIAFPLLPNHIGYLFCIALTAAGHGPV